MSSTILGMFSTKVCMSQRTSACLHECLHGLHNECRPGTRSFIKISLSDTLLQTWIYLSDTTFFLTSGHSIPHNNNVYICHKAAVWVWTSLRADYVTKPQKAEGDHIASNRPKWFLVSTMSRYMYKHSIYAHDRYEQTLCLNMHDLCMQSAFWKQTLRAHTHSVVCVVNHTQESHGPYGFRTLIIIFLATA
jgi:hypothetical protein